MSDKPTATALFRLDIDALEEAFETSPEMSGELRIVKPSRLGAQGTEVATVEHDEADASKHATDALSGPLSRGTE